MPGCVCQLVKKINDANRSFINSKGMKDVAIVLNWCGIGRVQKNSGGIRQAYYQSQVTLSAPAPLSLTTQVCYQ